MGLSSFMTTLLSIDRYINIDPSLRHLDSRIKTWFSHPRIHFLVFMTIICSLVISGLITAGTLTSRFHLYGSIASITCLVLILTPIVLYLHAYLKIKRYIRRNAIYNDSHQESISSRPRYFSKLEKTVFFPSLCLAAFYAPPLIISVYLSLKMHFNDDFFSTTQNFIINLSAVIFDLNSTVNGLLIIYRNKKVKAYLLNSFRNLCHIRFLNVTDHSKRICTTEGNTNF